MENLYHRRPNYQVDQFDLVHDMHELARETSSIDVPEGSFEGFREHGGKLIIYQGWSDFPIRPQSMLDYMQRAADAAGGSVVMAEFSRIYMVPGMLHCVGGPGAWVADYVSPMVDWVERGEAPERIVGTHTGVTGWFEALAAWEAQGINWAAAMLEASETQEGVRTFTRPFCPYPQLARYRGSGDIDAAGNFTCMEH